MKKEILFLGFFFIALVSLSFNISALTPAECRNNTIFTIYSEDNSHAAVYTGRDNGYGQAICYNTSEWGTGYANSLNPWACNGGNSIINLSSITNAHVSGLSYPVNICFGDIRCEVKNSCSTGEVSIASLSSLTNAHISSNSSYYTNYKLCCAKTSSLSVSAKWSNISDGMILLSSEKDSLVNLSVTITNPTSGIVNITVYNKSNDFPLAIFNDIAVVGGKAEITVNLSKDILMGNASIGATIYFNATYNSIVAKSNDLNIGGSVRTISGARWAGETISQTLGSINETNKTRLYVDTVGISDGEKIRFRIYKLNSPLSDDLVNESNYSVSSNRAYSSEFKLSEFMEEALSIGDKFYFVATDLVSGAESTSGILLYTKRTRSTTASCYIHDLMVNRDLCEGSMPEKPIINTCSVTNQNTYCYYDSGQCKTKTEGTETSTGNQVTICEENSRNELSECINGWKNLLVDVTTKPGCGTAGETCSEGNYRVPCRQVALLPVFTLGNIAIASGLIIIVYFIVFKSNMFKNSRKKVKNTKK